MQEIKLFYKNLYKSHDDSLENIDLSTLNLGNNVPKLTEEQKELLDRPVTATEILSTLKRFKNNKSPGTSGFQAEFFKFFWKDIGAFIVRSFNCSIRKGELSTSQKLGIITILPKGNKPREFLKNWRPISLLNTTYKLFSGVIANRLKGVLNDLIHENQKGFLSGRFIGENTRLLYDLIDHIEIQNKPGMVLLLDFEKAFDSVSWNFIYKVFDFFNFGEYFITLLKIILTDIKLCVIQHGFSSEFFNIGRGCRQGDPASPYIFLLCVEIMGLMLRENRDISGITLFGREYKVLQYADDTTILLDGSEKSLKSALSLVDQFSKFSGLKPNYDKTSCIRIGSLKYDNVEFATSYNIQWSQEPFSFLGITFTADLRNIIELNYRDKINSIRKMVTVWSRRNLSTIGRIIVVKSLIVPKLTHLFMSLPNPSIELLKEIDTIFFNYIWNSRVDRIARKCVVKQYSDGGLKMINTSIFIKSLKITWVRRLQQSNSSWATLLWSSLPCWFTSFHCLGNHFLDKIIHFLNPFWKDVFSALCDFKELVQDNILLTPIWCNDMFKVNNDYMFYVRWFNKGLVYIDDLLDENNDVLSLPDVNEKFDIRVPFTTYYSIVRTVRANIGQLNLVKIQRPTIPKYLNIILNDKKGCKNIYNVFISRQTDKPKHELKWEHLLNLHVNQNWWQKHYSIPFLVTKDTKLQWLQYRINYRILGTNSYLHKIKYIDTDLCTFCNMEPETIQHLFWDCIYINPLLGEFISWIRNICSEHFVLIASEMILGKTNASVIQNFLMILLKFYIYQHRLKKSIPDFTGFVIYVKYYQKLERSIYYNNNQIHKYNNRWSKFLLI